MGRDLAEAFPAAREVFAAVDDALSLALSRVMWEGPEDLLTRTDHAQPAILAHSAAVWAVVGPVLAAAVRGGAGHSLGEYTAHVAAGALGLADGARLVRQRGELMHEAGRARPGTMAAVLGLTPEAVQAACREASNADQVVVAANLNEPSQTVISGDPEAVARAGELLRAAGAKRVLPLKVSGAFHSPLMAPARDGLRAALEAAPLRDPAFPVVANATAEAVRDAATARRCLADQLERPVQWIACVQRLAELGGHGVAFVELGPGAVLAGLARRILPGATTLTLGTAAEVRAFLEAA
jgi:[acyl-carrier-protein] S-malonyltransferase